MTDHCPFHYIIGLQNVKMANDRNEERVSEAHVFKTTFFLLVLKYFTLFHQFQNESCFLGEKKYDLSYSREF